MKLLFRLIYFISYLFRLPSWRPVPASRLISLGFFICTFLPFLSAPIFAQRVAYLRTPGTNYCNVVGASNATPVQITVASASACGLANNAYIVIVDVEGNTAANINANANQLVRQVKNLAGNSFQIVDGAGNNIAGNGAYTRGGRLGPATAYTLKPAPVVWLDGAGGTLTTALSNTAATGRANANNPAYTALATAESNFVGTYGSHWGADAAGTNQVPMEGGENSALYWLATGNSSALTAAIWDVANVDQFAIPMCDTSQRQCNQINGNYRLDYAAWQGPAVAQLYSIVHDQLTSAQRAFFLAWALNDQPSTAGGFDTTTHTPLPFKNGSGTLTLTQGSTSVTGSGTAFTTQAAVGDYILFPSSGYPIYSKIASISSDTALTLTYGFPQTSGSSTTYGGYQIIPPFATNNYGVVWYIKHGEQAILCGGSQCTTNYPTTGGQGGSGTWNLSATQLAFEIQLGIATCGDDMRGCNMLEQAYEYWYDQSYPFDLSAWTGLNQSGYNYSEDRTLWMYGTIRQSVAASFTNGPNLPSGNVFSHTPAMFYMGDMPNTNGNGTVMPYGEVSGQAYWDVLHLQSLPIVLYLNASSNEGQYANYWMKNNSGYYTAQSIGGGGGGWVPMFYVFVDPAFTASNLSGAPTAYGFNQTDYASCLTIFGSAGECQLSGSLSANPSQVGFWYAISKTGFSASDTKLQIDAQSNNYYMDHSGFDVGNVYGIQRNVSLMAGDNSSTAPWTGLIELGGADHRIQAYPNWAVVNMPRWTDGANEAAQNKFAYALVDSTGAYTAAGNASRIQRHLAHLKKPGTQDYIVEYDDLAVSQGEEIRAYYDMAIDGCGTPSSSSCISASLSTGKFQNKQSNAVLNTLVVPVSTLFISNANASNTNGSYAAGKGYTWEYWVCASSTGTSCTTSATSGEWIMIHQPSTTVGSTMPPVTAPAVTAIGGNATAVQISDPTGPKVSVFARQGATLTLAAFTTTHAGTAQYLVAGLKAGSYSVTLNGSAISGSPFAVANGDNTLYFEGASGAYNISMIGGSGQAPVIVAFNASPSAIAPGQSSTLSWSVSGSPAPTLSINNGVGTVTGKTSQAVTPASSTTYTLTATNSAGTDSSNATITVSSATQPPSAPGNLTGTAASASRINLTWAASTSTVGLANYIVQRCQGATCTNFAQIASLAGTATTYGDTGLTASTSYGYQVQAIDTTGNSSPFSNIAGATTLPAAATIQYVQGSYATPQTPQTSVTVTFAGSQTAGDLNVLAVGWNDSINVVNAVTDKSGNTYTRAVGPTIISGTASQSIYYAKNIVAAAAGANAVTVTFSGGAVFPDVRILEYRGADPNNPLDVTAAQTGNNSSTTSGPATTTNATDLLLGANYIATAVTGAGSGFTSRMVTLPDSDIVEDQMVTATGTYSATAPDNPAGWWVMQMVAFRAASGGGDITPPTVPGNLTATAMSTSQINLDWAPSKSAIGVAGYYIYRNGVQVGTTARTAYPDTGLTPATSYKYAVAAFDAAGNASARSTPVFATTSGAALTRDTTPPPAPANLTATSESPSTIGLSWTASTDNVSVAGYHVYRNGVQIATTAAPSYKDTGLTPSTAYGYAVTAYDAGNNVSAQSPSAFATTGAGPSLAGCPVFPGNNVWNTPINKLPVDPNSSAYLATIGGSAPLHADFSSSGGGIPYNIVAASVPRVKINFFDNSQGEPGPYPIPTGARVESGSDQHVLVLDQGNCTLYELWEASLNADGVTWSANNGAAFDLKSNILRPSGWTSADAAGLPILPGLVRYDEVMSGHIDHAIRMTAPETRDAFIWPARHHASSLTGQQYPPMGQRFRLRAAFDVTPYPADVQVILNALKTYGAILADNGSPWYLTGAPDSRWNDSDLSRISQVVGNNMEAVDESALAVSVNSAAVAGSPIALSGIYLNQREVGSAATVEAEAIITAAAPAGGTTVSVSSTNADAVSTPATVTIPAGSVSVPIPITVNSIGRTMPVVVSSSVNSITAPSPVLVVDGTSGATVPLLSAVNVSLHNVTGGHYLTGKVTLTATVPAGKTVVALSSSNPAVASVPATVPVVAGATAASFLIKTYAQTADAIVTISTILNGESLEIPISVTSGASASEPAER